MTDYNHLVAETREHIASTLAAYSNPMVAYSGGKDGLVAMYLINEARPNTVGVCELSFNFAQQTADIRETANRLGFNIVFKNSHDWLWLTRHKEFVFNTDTKIRAKSFLLRQQKTIKDYAKQHDHDLVIFGRRKQENSVKAMLYDAHGRTQYHPLREWRADDVWRFLASVGIDKPWVYTTSRGELQGNGPFYSLRPEHFGGIEGAWAYCHTIDPSIHPSRLED